LAKKNNDSYIYIHHKQNGGVKDVNGQKGGLRTGHALYQGQARLCGGNAHGPAAHSQPCDFQLYGTGWHQKVPGFFLFGVGSAAVERPDLLTGINLRKFSRRLASLFYTANAN